MRLAIVGLGPKGLFALERLLHHIRDLDPGSEIEIDAYEPHPFPGAGPVYSPDQPGYLRMNFREEHVNLWPEGGRAVPAEQQRSFVDWRASGGDLYPPRGEVGRYLMTGLDLLRRYAPANVRLRVIDEKVVGLERDDGAWAVRAAGMARHYEEVLIATGHEPRAGGTDQVAAGSVVVARGFALTFIDTALALTEGRGGRFEALDDVRLQYFHGADEVRVLIPYSRTGRPMLAKPARLDTTAEIELAGRDARERILSLPAGFSVTGDLAPHIAAVAFACLGGHEQDAIDQALAGAASGKPPRTSLTASEEMRQSVLIAMGRCALDLASALGDAWRAVYPALVTRLGGDGLQENEWPAFRRLAVNMERLAFGPSPENLMKLLALVDSGLVDLSYLSAAGPGAMPDADVVLDTVIAAPGARDSRGPLLTGLLADGHARVLPQQRGLDVLADGSCVGDDGQLTPGLSAIGRPTEDSVIGNDTLSRTLHPAADLWGRRVVESVPVPVVIG